MQLTRVQRRKSKRIRKKNKNNEILYLKKYLTLYTIKNKYFYL